MTERTFTAATMKVKLASDQTLSAKLKADARMTAKMDLMYKGDKGDKGDTGDTGETIASAYCNPDGTMVLTMDSGRRVATNLQPLTDSMGYAESAKESAAAAAASQQAASGSESAAASARTQQADWTETDSTFQSFIKNKPTNLLTTNTTQTITGDKEFTGAVIMATGNITAVNATSLTATGSTSVPTANADNNSNTVANTAFVKTAIANIVNGAPSQLDTLQELSAALGNDANFSATVANEIGEKVSKNGDTITGPILYDKTPNDDTELPNKAYVDAAINSAVAAAVTSVTKTLSDNMHAQYPVGSYIYSDKADNPATYLPYMSDTTWVQTAAGRVLIGAGTADSGTVYTAGQTGGEEKHQLTVDEIPPHTHTLNRNSGSGTDDWVLNDHEGKTKWQSGDVGSTGGGEAHNNMQPYCAVYIFKRTA